jgi:hypothetical protein
MDDLPIVCTLQPGELNARAAQLLPGIALLATKRVSIEHGWRLQFNASSEVLTAVIGAIDAERQCCRFLRFRLVVEPDGGPVLLDITGPEGTSGFLAAMLGEEVKLESRPRLDDGSEASRATRPTRRS